MDNKYFVLGMLLLSFFSACSQDETALELEKDKVNLTYKIVDTGTKAFYSNVAKIAKPKPGESFFGQVANYFSNQSSYTDKGDGTITDNVTGLMWQKADDGTPRNWEESLKYAEGLELAGKSDWRLPNAKELQSIVDYARSPQTTNSPATNPIFTTTEIEYPDGSSGHYPFFRTGTTHFEGANPYAGAVYISFGKGLGKMNGIVIDVHGAGCQRSDPKSGNKTNYPQYWGPQGDIWYVYNYMSCVRKIED